MDTALRTRIDGLVEELDARLAELVELPVGMPTTPQDALDALRAVERLAGRVRSAQLSLAEAVERSEVWKADGHRLAHQMVGRACRLSYPEELRRDRSVRALRELPCVAGALRDGRIGAPQVERIALSWANPRVREGLVELDREVAQLAASEPYDVLDRLLRNWESMVDEEGTAEASAAAHRCRDATLGQRPDGGWDGQISCGTLDGAKLHDILSAFCRAELEADWAHAREHHGDEATARHLERTDAQRRFDALARIFRLAVGATDGEAAGPTVETIIVIDEETFDRHLRRLAGQSLPPAEIDLEGRLGPAAPPSSSTAHGPAGSVDPPVDLDDVEAALAWRDEHRRTIQERATGRPFRSHTIDGCFVDPTEAVANALSSDVRRAVVSAPGVTVDLGRRQRLFAGHASLAARLTQGTCYWAGCRVSASRCQTDHLRSWAEGGPTDQANGGLACGHHNRIKEHGFTVRRAADGRIHFHRPDGSRIE